jgi:vancomycin resistance protein YoaR
VPFAMRADGATVDGWVSAIVAAVDRPASDGVIVATYSGVDVTPAVVGRSTDATALRRGLLGPDTLGDRALALSVHESYPAVDPSGMRVAAARAIAATTPLVITAGDRSVSEDPAGLVTLLRIERTVAERDELDPIPAGAAVASTRYAYHVDLDAARVAQWVSRLAALLDHPSKNATYAVQPDGTLAVVPAADGVKIDQPGLVADVMARLFTAASAPREIAPAVSADVPTFTTAQATQFAPQMTLVSSYTTTYPANLARHANITTGAMQFNDLVLAPGEAFSFWNLLGPVTVERGYAFAGAIIDGRSDENVIGGGLCQVSTTLFNAVARAGYEIIERHEHGYYIDRYPLGFDAAVFEPGVDFQWKNDTDYPVLIRGYRIQKGSRGYVKFELYSVPNGRTVVIGPPTVKNIRPASDSTQLTTSLSPEARKRIEYPVDGKQVWRTVTVYDATGAVLHAQTYYSNYARITGIVLIGVRPTAPAPAPEPTPAPQPTPVPDG